jgi:carbamoyl-phosphate synthase large subunit
VGLMNVQFAIQGDDIYVLEVNPRASRTVPFVSKASGRPLAKIAALCMAGISLKEQGVLEEIVPKHYSVKESVFPFAKFPGVDPLLGPEMKSTGEVMGVGRTFAEAFGKSQQAAGIELPTEGRVFLSVREADKPYAADLAKRLNTLGFDIIATSGTAKSIESLGVACERVNKVKEGRPHVVDRIKNHEVTLIINTTEGKLAVEDSFSIRREALNRKVTYFTTMAGAEAFVEALENNAGRLVYRLQELQSSAL